MLKVILVVFLSGCVSAQYPSEIPPERLYWPKTVVKSYDRNGNVTGYSVIQNSPKGKK